MVADPSNMDIKEAVPIPNTRVVVRDQEGLDRKKRAIRAAGPQRLQIVSDFDMTLTRFNVNGKKGQSCHSLLSQKNDQYNQMRQDLYKHYYPLEIDQSIPYDKKVKLMEEWYEKSHATLLEGGLTLDEIRDSVANANVAFREETAQLFELLDSKRVPVLIFSAGLADVLEEVLRQKLHRAFGNIRVVSNRMKFDEEGRLQSFVGSLIHSLNKNEHAIALAGPMHDEQGRVLDDLEHREPSDGSTEPAIDGLDGRSVVAGRNNVILLGDHLGDLGMSRGVDVDEQISIAFLNDKVEENLEVFASSFDVVLIGDGSMKEVITIVEDIL
ncbi:cytosolic 5-nucleotidase III [Klebsormidium nitens]|uniref:5'-nucleotidase n=1 Tax=Klebsormidium nitens TaxID=105231 RepID=A0A1Y1IB28_KLENI|nr:cytosolic 5-nucleotidase III [Klebsormidium nitens]|eukprot:GAQ86629.1 cytosolic 5-nucleotidase III [Klebsormidium nitens]